MAACIWRFTNDDDDAQSVESGWSPTRFERIFLSWCLRHAAHVESENNLFITAFGWPMPALWYQSDWEHSVTRPDGDMYLVQGGLNLPWFRRQSFARLDESCYECVALPLKPYWLGLAFNTTLYAAAWSAVLWAIPTARIRFRHRRNLCHDCGYDLSATRFSDPCPECGTRPTPPA